MAVIKRVRLSEIAELVTKGTTPTTLGYEFQDTGVNFLKIECFSEKGDYIQNKATHISEECHEKLKRSQLKEGDILFSIAGVIGRVAIVTRARNMVHKFENRIDSMFRCGIGRVKELGSVKESFKEAVVALRESTSHVVHIEDVPAAQKYDGEYPRDLEIRYQKRILEKDAAGAMNCAEGFFEWMYSQQTVTREDIEIKILEMVMNAERRAFFAGTLKYNVNSRRSYIRELQSCTDIENLKKWFLDKTREICTKLENSKEKEAGSIIDRAKEYINENFRRDISLDDVSREVDISPYYFSKLFKQETGKNFIEYLTEIRLKNARELLQDSRLSIKEICAQSGYSDPNYFSRIFKKYEGVTPSEFRERLG